MSPNEFDYYLFLILVAILIFLSKKIHAQIVILLVASYFLYIYSNHYLVFSLAYTTILTYYCAEFINKNDRKKLYLIIAIVGALGQLALFKYTRFLDTIGISFSAIGISYYTFMALGYVIEIYRGKLRPANSLIEYGLFVSFFPIITSGPIIRAKDFFSQLINRITITPENFQQGVTLITIGLMMKLVIADNLAGFVDLVFSDPESFGSHEIRLATLAFGVQLYCDFGGYSDIALGSARILGFKFPMNFNNPYFALNPQDFWHRWNISLSSWLRDYLYIPLGGNRKGVLRNHINLIITMAFCGLWHGATWNFLIWGVYHGVLLSLHRSVRVPNNRALLAVGILLTQYFVFLGWIIFRINNLDDLKYCLYNFIVPTGFEYMSSFIGIIAVLILLFYRNKIANNHWIEDIGSTKPIYWFIYLIIAINLIYWLSPVKVTKFIYAGF
jgi:alginate O-acetyltransferase complex protein AlgI